MFKTRCSYDTVDIVDIVSISSILCRYRTYISIIRNLYYVDIDSISIRYRHVTGSTVLLSISSISIRYRFVIVGSSELQSISSISSFSNGLVSWITVDIVDIDMISFRDCWISCIAVDIVDIVDIDTISILYRHVHVWSTVLLSISLISSISIQYRHVLVGSIVLLSISLISIRYRYDIVSWLSDQLYCCQYRRYRHYIDTILLCSCWISCFVAYTTE